MEEATRYYVVTRKAVPEVLMKVVKAKGLMDSGKVETVQDAVDQVGISRSSFYKYKDDIFPFHDNVKGKTITLSLQIDDRPGLLSDVLTGIAKFGANILTIHQSIPVGGIAAVSVSVQALETTGDISEMLAEMEHKDGVRGVKILAGD